MHRLTNFKNFAKADLNLFEPLTVLLGRNGSGKTNLIEGVELLAALARGTPLNGITDIGRGGTFEVRGGLQSCIRFGRRQFSLRFNEATIELDKEAQPVDYSIEVAWLGKGLQLSAEKLRVGDRVLFDAENPDGELMKVTYDNFARGKNPTRQISASRAVLSRYEELIRDSRANNPRLHRTGGVVAGVRRYLREAYIFDPQPKAMRDYARVDPSAELLRSGANLSAVLHALSQGSKEGLAALQRITEVIRQIPEEPFTEIGFAETSLGDVMAGFVPNGTAGKKAQSEDLVDARLLSDGTLRMLAIVTALETVPSPSRIVIEEFDNGLHPSRVKLLVRYLSETASRRELNVLVTTHNPAFMDAVEEQTKGVLICHGDESGGGARVTRLGDMDIAGTIALRGGLGDFVTRGALEAHLAPDFAQRRSEEARDWLASLA